MPFSMIALMLAASTSGATIACSEVEQPRDYHIWDVCSAVLQGEPAYSATWSGSLTPQPAAQQVVVYRMEGQWFVRVAGFSWNGEAINTRRREIGISDADATRVQAAMAADTMQQLAELPYYGERDVICMDGANLELATAIGGQRRSARQHSCAGHTAMNEVAAVLHDIAIHYDPESAALLGGLAPRQAMPDQSVLR